MVMVRKKKKMVIQSTAVVKGGLKMVEWCLYVMGEEV